MPNSLAIAMLAVNMVVLLWMLRDAYRDYGAARFEPPERRDRLVLLLVVLSGASVTRIGTDPSAFEVVFVFSAMAAWLAAICVFSSARRKSRGR